MKVKNVYYIILTACLLYANSSTAQNIENPKITDFKWLAGNWVGDGFGGQSQEAWTEPSANGMVGVYKHYRDGKSTFYEFINLSETDGKISLKLKHFNPDMMGWEEKADFVEFPFVSATASKIEFKGLSYELIAEDKMEVKLRLNRNGKINIETFNFERQRY
jgi:hypothetical protein